MMNNHVPVSTIDKILEEIETFEIDPSDYELPDKDLEKIATSKAILILHG